MTKFLVAGASGMVGRAIVKSLKKAGHHDIYEVTSQTCDLRDNIKTLELFRKVQPNVVIDAAAKVGGIDVNQKFPVDFLLDNLQIQNSLITSSHEVGVEKFVFLSSSCVYPKFAEQPIKEKYLLTGPLEPTNSAYAVAKISGMSLIKAFREQYGHNWISVMPTNLFGPFDNFSLTSSHVIPAIMRKIHEAKLKNQDSVTFWGSGEPRREFMFVEDFSSALMYVLDNYNDPEAINIGTGNDIKINEIASILMNIIGYEGVAIWDHSMPDGTPRKVLDITKLKNLGFTQNNSLNLKLSQTYDWFLEKYTSKDPVLKL